MEDNRNGFRFDIECLSISELKQLLMIGCELREKGRIESDFKEVNEGSAGDLKHSILTVLMDGAKDLSDLQYAIFSRRLETDDPDYVKILNVLYNMKKKGIISKAKGRFMLVGKEGELDDEEDDAEN
jgi:hypothetical protein